MSEMRRDQLEIQSRPRYPPGCWLVWTGACLAVLILGIIAIPWPTPSRDVQLDRFDPVLVTIDPRGFLQAAGEISVGPREVRLSTRAHTQPTVHLLTAEIPFAATFSASILNRDSASVFPLQIKVWNPRVEVAAEAWYAPDGTIFAGIRVGDRWERMDRLGGYQVGGIDTWRIVRTNRQLTFEVSGHSTPATFEVYREKYPALFDPLPVSLTVYASAPDKGFSTAVVRNPHIVVPHQTAYGATVAGTWFRPVVGVVALLSLGWVAMWMRRRWKRPMILWRDLAIVSLLMGGSLVAGWLVSKTPGQPYDVQSFLVWSHLAREHGLAAVTTYSLVATEHTAHGGQPYAAMTYPYPPLLTYLAWVVGKVAPIGKGEQTFKLLATSIVAVGGVVLYAVLRRLRIAPAVAALAMGVYVLNPAVLFDSAVWGQTDSVVALFLLIGAAGIVLEAPPLVWVGALLAFLTKQTGGIFAPVILAVGFAKLGPRQMLQVLSPAVLIVFLVLSPAFIAGIHPSAIYQPVITKALGWGTVRSMEAANAVVAQGSFTLWSALVGLVQTQPGASLAFPDFIPSRLGPSYFILSRVAFALFVALLGLVFFRRRTAGAGVVFLTIATFGVGMAVLLTRILPRYFYFGVMFTAASLPWMPRKLGAATLAVLTGTMLTSMWGLLALVSVWHPGLLPIFDPSRSLFNYVAAWIFNTDTGPIVGGLMNTAALIALGFATSLQRTRDEQADAPVIGTESGLIAHSARHPERTHVDTSAPAVFGKA